MKPLKRFAVWFLASMSFLLLSAIPYMAGFPVETRWTATYAGAFGGMALLFVCFASWARKRRDREDEEWSRPEPDFERDGRFPVEAAAAIAVIAIILLVMAWAFMAYSVRAS